MKEKGEESEEEEGGFLGGTVAKAPFTFVRTLEAFKYYLGNKYSTKQNPP